MNRTVAALACALAVHGCTHAQHDSKSIGSHADPLAAAGALATGRSDFAWTLTKDGTPFFSGGYDDMMGGSNSLIYTEVFDLGAHTWSRLKDSQYGHAGHTVTYLPSVDRILIVGGTSGDPNPNELYDATINKWLDDPSPGERLFHTATLLASGKLLIAGGVGPGPTYAMLQPLLYDPKAASGARWSPAGTMIKPRKQHSAVVVGDKVLVAGGGDATTVLDDSELYDPGTNTWTATSALNEARNGVRMLQLKDGTVLAAGGWNGVGKSSAELFDPVTKKWSYTTDLDAARAEPSASLLSTGRVLVAGGDGPAAATTTVYDPTTKKWSPGPTLAETRYAHAAIPLPGGRILIVGGRNAGGTKRLSTSEIFGGLAGGAACVIDEECVSGKCTGGVCAGATDAGPSDAATDSGLSTTDAQPPDAAAKPIASGNFTKCTSGSQCQTGFCVDGICCDTACDAPCHSCALAGSPGICSLEPYGTDRKNACGVSGACVATCDGKGGCTAAASGTQCAFAKCTGPSTGVGPAVCAAAGAACNDSARAEFDCSPFACEPALAACRSTCVESSDCAPGFVCDAPSRTCTPAPPSDDSGGCAYSSRPSPNGALFALIVALFAGTRRRAPRADT
ncbi:MAG: Kelch repeat-containing protein [Polyangiales bacterium]